MVEFIIISALLSPLVIMIMDYLIKATYLLVHDSINGRRFEIFLDCLNRNALELKRITVDGKFVIIADFFGDKYQYICKKDGTVALHGMKERRVMYIYNKEYNYSLVSRKISGGALKKLKSVINKQPKYISPYFFVVKGHKNLRNNIRYLKFPQFVGDTD